MDGTLVTTDELDLRTGDKIAAGAIVASVADLSTMRMKINVHEHNISKVQVGENVRVYLNAYPAMLYHTLRGKVTKIISQARSDETGTYIVTIVTLDPNSFGDAAHPIQLRPGMAGYAKIEYDASSFFTHAVQQSFDSFREM
jgi:hypothetical protein